MFEPLFTQLFAKQRANGKPSRRQESLKGTFRVEAQDDRRQNENRRQEGRSLCGGVFSSCSTFNEATVTQTASTN